MEIVKKVLMVTLVCFALVMASIVQEKEAQLEQLENKSEQVDSLESELENMKKFNDEQAELILQLTYQHEDDDALYEEEQP